jgi:hypothetical protein
LSVASAAKDPSPESGQSDRRSAVMDLDTEFKYSVLEFRTVL